MTMMPVHPCRFELMVSWWHMNGREHQPVMPAQPCEAATHVTDAAVLLRSQRTVTGRDAAQSAFSAAGNGSATEAQSCCRVLSKSAAAMQAGENVSECGHVLQPISASRSDHKGQKLPPFSLGLRCSKMSAQRKSSAGAPTAVGGREFCEGGGGQV